MKKITIGYKGTILLGVLTLLCGAYQTNNMVRHDIQVQKLNVHLEEDTDAQFIMNKLEELDVFFATGNNGKSFAEDVYYLINLAKEKIEEIDLPLSTSDKAKIDDIVVLYKTTITQLAPKYEKINFLFREGNVVETLNLPFYADCQYLVDRAKQRIKDVALPISGADINTIDEMIEDYFDALKFLSPLHEMVDKFFKADNAGGQVYREAELTYVYEEGKAAMKEYDFPLSEEDKGELTSLAFHIQNDLQIKYYAVKMKANDLTGRDSQEVLDFYQEYLDYLDTLYDDAYGYSAETAQITTLLKAAEKKYSDLIFAQKCLDTFIMSATENDSVAVRELIEKALAEITKYAEDHDYKFTDTTRKELEILTERLFVQVRNLRDAEKAREFFMYFLGIIIVLQLMFFVYSLIKKVFSKAKVTKLSTILPLYFLVAMPEAKAMQIIYIELAIMACLLVGTWLIYYLKAPKSTVKKSVVDETHDLKGTK